MKRRALILLIILSVFAPPFAKAQAAYYHADMRPADLLQEPQTELADAIQSGKVEAWAQPNPSSFGFKQPLIVLHIKNLSGSPLSIHVPAGVKLQAVDEKHADLVVANEAVVSVNGESQAPLNAFGLQYNRALPSGMEEGYRYAPAEVVTGDLLALLMKITADGQQEKMGAQLAIWSVTAQTSPADLDLKPEARAEDLQTAHGLLKAINWPYLPADLPAPVNTAASDVTQPVDQTPAQATSAVTAAPGGGGGGSGGLGGVLIAVLVVIVLAGVVIDQIARRKKIDDERRKQAEIQRSLDEKMPSASPSSKAKLTLTGITGQFTGRIFEITRSTVISRNAVTWFLLADDGVLSPHVAVDFLSQPFLVKNLVSTANTRMNNDDLGQGFAPWPAGCRLRLGERVQLIPLETGIMVEQGRKIGLSAQRSENLTLVSHEKYDVIEMGLADLQVSDAHAVFLYQNEHWSVRDLNSSNGVWHNGRRIMSETALNTGDLLKIGQTEFEVKIH